MVEGASEVVLLPSFVSVSMLSMLMMRWCDSVVAGVARLGDFPLHLRACLWCVLAGSPGRLDGNLTFS